MPHTTKTHGGWATGLVCLAGLLVAFEAGIAPAMAYAGPAGGGDAADATDDRRGRDDRVAPDDDRFTPDRRDARDPDFELDERGSDRERRWRRVGVPPVRRDDFPSPDDDEGPRYFTKMPGGFGPLGARVKLTYSQLDGKIEKETPSGGGNEIRLARDLDIERREWVPTAGIFAKIGERLELGVDYTYVSHSGEVALATPVSLRGTLFSPGQNVRSRTSLHDVSIGADITLLDVGFLRLTLPVGFRYFNYEVRVRSSAGLSQSERTESLMPYVGFGIEGYPVSFIRLGGGLKLGGSTYHGAKDLAGFAALEAHAAFVWNDRVEIGVGYDFVSVDIEKDRGDDEQVDLELGGPSVFLRIKF